jgi:hypothetical protein
MGIHFILFAEEESVRALKHFVSRDSKNILRRYVENETGFQFPSNGSIEEAVTSPGIKRVFFGAPFFQAPW